MPSVKTWATILCLATSSEGIGTVMFLADLKTLIDASSTPDGITAHELDARAEGVYKVCDQFTSVSALKDFMRSCLRAEAIKSVAAHSDKIRYAHEQANIMVKDSKPIPTLAKTYLTAAADPALNIDEKKEQNEHCSKCSSVIGQIKSAPDKGFRMTPMIPPRNSMAVVGVATCAVVSPQ